MILCFLFLWFNQETGTEGTCFSYFSLPAHHNVFNTNTVIQHLLRDDRWGISHQRHHLYSGIQECKKVLEYSLLPPALQPGCT